MISGGWGFQTGYVRDRDRRLGFSSPIPRLHLRQPRTCAQTYSLAILVHHPILPIWALTAAAQCRDTHAELCSKESMLLRTGAKYHHIQNRRILPVKEDMI